MGYTENFSANFYCRFCKIDKKQGQFAAVVDETLLRKKESYEKDLLIDDLR